MRLLIEENDIVNGVTVLTNSAGNRQTLHNVAFVPDGQDRILSFIKFRREHKAEFTFTGPETFTSTTPNNLVDVANFGHDLLCEFEDSFLNNL